MWRLEVSLECLQKNSMQNGVTVDLFLRLLCTCRSAVLRWLPQARPHLFEGWPHFLRPDRCAVLPLRSSASWDTLPAATR